MSTTERVKIVQRLLIAFFLSASPFFVSAHGGIIDGDDDSFSSSFLRPPPAPARPLLLTDSEADISLINQLQDVDTPTRIYAILGVGVFFTIMCSLLIVKKLKNKKREP